MVDKKLLENLGWPKDLIDEITRTSELISNNYPDTMVEGQKALSATNFSCINKLVNVSTNGIFYKP